MRFYMRYCAYFIERILEDFEILDVSTIVEYSRSRVGDRRYSNDSRKGDIYCNDPEQSKYYLVLRQSAAKYDMFHRPQVGVHEIRMKFFRLQITNIKLRF